VAIARSPETLREKMAIDLRLKSEAIEIDLKARRVRARSFEGGREYSEPFDDLLVATGASPIRPAIPGLDSPGVYGVATLEDGVRLRRDLESGEHARAVVVGGGYIGLEMTEALLSQGLQVSLVDMLPQVMGTLDADMASLVEDALRKLGVELHLGEALKGFEVRDGRLAAVVTDKGSLPASVAVLGLGVRPNGGLAGAAGLPLGEKGAIKVDDRLRTPVEGVWAAGDCAESFHLVSRRPIHIALGTVANKHGRVAGINIAGGDARFPGVVGTAVTRLFDTELARTGLQEREAKALGLDYAASRIEGRTRAGYFPGAAPVTVKLLAEKGSRRLLGGQIVGAPGSGKRIDVVAAALCAGLTVDDVINLDLAYAPPLSGTWDPIQIAARQVLRRLSSGSEQGPQA
jgi:NADPH-dependent 2,4-dienoyl-CoA reductase/sulfur reductase-like enzyme